MRDDVWVLPAVVGAAITLKDLSAKVRHPQQNLCNLHTHSGEASCL